MKKCGKTIIKYGLPALCVLILGCIILAVQGIWPFGNESIDYYDMAQQLAAEYIQVYDELHFDKSMFFDWYLNLGRGIPGGTYIAFSNLLFYLFPRDAILYSFSILFLVKIMAMAVTMRILLEKEACNCPEFFKVILAAGYGLCGFVLMQYTIISWLDVAVLVPLIVLFTKRALTEGKIIGLTVCITLSLLLWFVVPAMVLIFIFMIAGLYIAREYLFKKKLELHVCRLGIAVAFGLLISSWSWIPKVTISAGGFRYELESSSTIVDKYLEVLRHVRPDYATRWWALLGVSFAAAVSLIGIVRDIKKKNGERLFFVIGAFIISLIQLVFENIQLFWHLGSYVNYPVRNGFVMYIVFALTAATYLPEILKTDEESIIKPENAVAYLIAAIAASVFAGFGIGWYNANSEMSIYAVFKVSMLCVIATFFVYLFLLLYKGGRHAKISSFLIAAELIFYGVLLIGKPNYVTGYAEEVEQEGDYIRIANDLKASLGIEESYLDRIKNPDESLNTNYGLFLKRPTLSGWTTFATRDAIMTSAKKGYSVQYTRLLDAGGDVLLDALYHVTQVISCLPQSEGLYDKISSTQTVTDYQKGTIAEYSLYDCRYTLPFGNVVQSKELLDKITGVAGDEYDNALVQSIGAGDEKLKDAVVKEVLYEGSYADSLTLDIKGNKAVYFCGMRPDSETKNLQLWVNGEPVMVPSLKETDNTLYSAHFNNGNLLLGCFSDEEVLISFDRKESDNNSDYDFSVYTIDLDIMRKLCEYAALNQGTFTAGKATLDANVIGEEGNYLLLPIQYDDSWNATVNGMSVDIEKVDSFLMAIPLVAGENVIHMEYFPKDVRSWGIVSIIAICVFVVGCCLEVVKKSTKLLSTEQKADSIIGTAYCVGWTGVIALFVFVPVVYGLIYYIKQII